MERDVLGARLLRLVANTAVLASPLGVLGKIWAIVSQVMGFLWGLPKDDVDFYLDLIEKNNHGNSSVMAAMKAVRLILKCPDEIGEDQANPI